MAFAAADAAAANPQRLLTADPHMGFFSRKNAAPDAPSVDVPFDAIRRSPRSARKPRTVVAGDPSAEPAAPLDPARGAKTRARRRLMGAVALALAAIVFVPMLFDRAPATPPNDIALQIPDKDSPFEGRRGVPDNRGPLAAAMPLPPTPTDDAAAASAVTDVAPADGGRIESGVATKPIDAPAPAKTADRPGSDKPLDKGAAVEKSTDRTAERPRPPASSDDPRAIAALEGKPESSSAASSTSSSAEASAKSFAVQIAAFSAADKARGLRDQLSSNGLKSYTESVSTPQGLRTRVRLGPFPSREAADRARQKLKTMKLEGSVVAL